eukprot:CAMPEP_0118913398 /NCGR_PEP_ID=MMETSP1166-20130328/14230_1 /TAXON_ID=1104430 /ORGANISM="Chrysoreinhardia sp, Strain CCMP3193" /LENGTH=802 /DNA_ID=CAMNT_0006852955 /DNA_START=35 /DNA_END=2440 /DNA_ORIENTATION=+
MLRVLVVLAMVTAHSAEDVTSPSLRRRVCPRGPIVSIPSVPKGLANQRMRIVQDLTVALSLGYAVELPEHVHSRIGCRYELDCAAEYASNVSTWTLYDFDDTVAALERLGLCVSSGVSAPLPEVAPVTWPRAASELTDVWLDLERHKKTRSSSSSRTTTQKWYLAKPTDCCTFVVPDSDVAVDLLRDVGDALVPSEAVRRAATDVATAFFEKKKKKTNNKSPSVLCAAHWRDDEDMVLSQHRLSRAAYDTKMVKAIRSACGTRVLLLGGFSAERLEDIRAMLPGVSIDTKTTLQPTHPFLKANDPYDDVLALVDFELGRQYASVFVSSPFSSFSNQIAFSRMGRGVVDVDVDTQTKLGLLWRIQFPTTRDPFADPCAALANQWPKSRLSPRSCPFNGGEDGDNIVSSSSSEKVDALNHVPTFRRSRAAAIISAKGNDDSSYSYDSYSYDSSSFFFDDDAFSSSYDFSFAGGTPVPSTTPAPTSCGDREPAFCALLLAGDPEACATTLCPTCNFAAFMRRKLRLLQLAADGRADSDADVFEAHAGADRETVVVGALDAADGETVVFSADFRADRETVFIGALDAADVRGPDARAVRSAEERRLLRRVVLLLKRLRDLPDDDIANAEFLSNATLSVVHRGNLGDPSESAPLHVDGVLVAVCRSNLPDCAPTYEPCLSELDVLPQLTDDGALEVELGGSSSVLAVCTDKASPYALSAQITLTIECVAGANDDGCVTPPTPVPTAKPCDDENSAQCAQFVLISPDVCTTLLCPSCGAFASFCDKSCAFCTVAPTSAPTPMPTSPPS